MVDVVVIGAGVAGVAAALELAKAGARVTVVDEAPAAGGVLRSHATGGFVFEDGPTSVLDLGGEFSAVARELGLGDQVVGAREEARIRHVFHDGALRRVPSSPADLAGSPLVTFLEAARIAREAFVKPLEEEAEETVTAFLERRFGKSVTRKYASALVSGVCGGDPDRLSLDAAFPELRAMERAHGSILRGAAAKAREPRPAGRRGLVSLRGGLGAFGEAATRVLGARLRLRARVASIVRRPAGGVRLAVASGAGSEPLDADVAIVATGAPAASRLVRDAAPEAADGLARIVHASAAVVQAGFRRDELPGLPPGFGFLVPRGEGLASLGWLFLSQVFDERAPDGCVALGGFFGGVLASEPLAHADDEIGRLALRELGQAIGRAAPPRPEVLRIVRWTGAFPQYELGHRGRIEAVVASLRREAPGVLLAGNYLGGISVPAALASGRAAAAGALRGAEAVR